MPKNIGQILESLIHLDNFANKPTYHEQHYIKPPASIGLEIF